MALAMMMMMMMMMLKMSSPPMKIQEVEHQKGESMSVSAMAMMGPETSCIAR